MIRFRGHSYRRAVSEPHLVQLKQNLLRDTWTMAVEAIMYDPRSFFSWWRRWSEYGSVDLDELVDEAFLEAEEVTTLGELADTFMSLDEEEQQEFLHNRIDADILDDYLDDDNGATAHLIGNTDAPTHVYMEHERDLGDTWLIHFTKPANVRKIQQNGFQYGMQDPDAIGFTTHVPKHLKKGPGYSFAYTVRDYPEFLVHPDGAERWHKGAVLFRAEALYVRHKTDNDYQAIFWGPAAYDIVALLPTKDTYAIVDCDGSYVDAGDTLDDAIQWVIQNINRYPNLVCI